MTGLCPRKKSEGGLDGGETLISRKLSTILAIPRALGRRVTRLSTFFQHRDPQVQDVEAFYDRYTSEYLEVFGNDILQSWRPSDPDELIQYIVNSSSMEDGQRVLDAGCGVCGPAIRIAELLDVEISAVTISQRQVEMAREKIHARQFSERIEVIRGDYHYLDALYPDEHFDVILFLESLSHAADPQKVVKAAAKVLKPGGWIYVKDVFARELENGQEMRQIKRHIERVNAVWRLGVLDLCSTISSLRRTGLAIVFVRRPGFCRDRRFAAEFLRHFGLGADEAPDGIVATEHLEIKCQKVPWLPRTHQSSGMVGTKD